MLRGSEDQAHGPGADHFVGFDISEDMAATIGARNSFRAFATSLNELGTFKNESVCVTGFR
jgi:hypothetical protein